MLQPRSQPERSHDHRHRRHRRIVAVIFVIVIVTVGIDFRHRHHPHRRHHRHRHHRLTGGWNSAGDGARWGMEHSSTTCSNTHPANNLSIRKHSHGNYFTHSSATCSNTHPANKLNANTKTVNKVVQITHEKNEAS